MIPSEIDLPDFAMSFYAIIDFSNEAEFSVTIDPSALVTVSTMNTAISDAVSVKQDKIMALGLLKGDGAGNITGATAGVDFGFPQKSGDSDPTSSTPGMVGQRFLNTATGREFICIAASEGVYTWEAAGANDTADITQNGRPLDEYLDEMSQTQADLWLALDAVVESIPGDLYTQAQTNQLIADAVYGHNTAGDAHGDMRAGMAALDSRTTNLEMIIGGGIATNLFSITFANLAGVIVTGVWNNTQGRIEF